MPATFIECSLTLVQFNIGKSSARELGRHFIFGDPTLATLAKGVVLLDAMTGDLIEQAKSFIVEPVVTASRRGHVS